MASSSAKYGLFIPKKSTKGVVIRPATANVFGDESDEESVNETVNKEAARAKVKKQTQLEIDKALQEDPSVYEYDNIYDDIHAEKVNSSVKEANKIDKKPKYIAGLLKMAEVRKREEERRVERKVQKEREEEGGQFADKEAFVTSAYKKKLQERQEQEERERREAAMEDLLDVTKQKDLSGFYRYLYRETTGAPQTQGKDGEEEDRAKSKEGPSTDSSGSSSDAESDREIPHRKEKIKTVGHLEHRRKERMRTTPGFPKHGSDQSDSERLQEECDRYSNKQRSRSPVDRRSHQGRHGSDRDRAGGKSRVKDKVSRRSSSRDRSRSDRTSKRCTSRDRLRSDKTSKHSTSRDRSRSDRNSKRSTSRDRSRSDRNSKRSTSRDRSRSDRTSKRSTSRDRSRSKEGKKQRLERKDERLRDEGSSSSDDQAPSPPSTEAGPLPHPPPATHPHRHNSPSGSKLDRESPQAGRTAGPAKGNRGEGQPASKYTKKTSHNAALEARKRFLARKLEKERARGGLEPQ